METIDPKLKERFQSIVGALNYCVSNTRQDVAYSVGQLCRVLARPTPELLPSFFPVPNGYTVTCIELAK